MINNFNNIQFIIAIFEWEIFYFKKDWSELTGFYIILKI